MSDGFSVRLDFGNEPLMGSVKYANRKAMRGVGAYVRRVAVNSVHRSRSASAAGTPPHTRRGLLKNSILFGVEGDGRGVVIGPAKSVVGISMTAHEFGGMYRGRKYPKRQLMGPALMQSAPELPKLWKDAIR